jgi:hypothetical protein
MNLNTARATLDCARADVDEETDRMKVLDGKLTNIAAFSGLALSIGGAVGSSVVVSGRLGLGFTIALGAVLSIAVSLLLARAILALSGLAPKNYRGITLEAARARVTPKRLELAPEEAVARLASTYYTAMLPQAREANQARCEAFKWAFRLVAGGLAGLVSGLILSSVGAVV